jgi:hypothetical protein
MTRFFTVYYVEHVTLSYDKPLEYHWMTWGTLFSDKARNVDVDIIQWIGLRENPQETIDFPIKYGVFL